MPKPDGRDNFARNSESFSLYDRACTPTLDTFLEEPTGLTVPSRVNAPVCSRRSNKQERDTQTSAATTHLLARSLARASIRHTTTLFWKLLVGIPFRAARAHKTSVRSEKYVIIAAATTTHEGREGGRGATIRACHCSREFFNDRKRRRREISSLRSRANEWEREARNPATTEVLTRGRNMEHNAAMSRLMLLNANTKSVTRG